MQVTSASPRRNWEARAIIQNQISFNNSNPILKKNAINFIKILKKFSQSKQIEIF